MPITIDRLARLVEAADAYMARDRQYQSLLTSIDRSCEQAKLQEIPYELAIANISAILTRAPRYTVADEVVIEERTLQNHTRRKNILERERQRTKRAADFARAHASIGPTDDTLDLGDDESVGNPAWEAYEQKEANNMTDEERKIIERLSLENRLRSQRNAS